MILLLCNLIDVARIIVLFTSVKIDSLYQSVGKGREMSSKAVWGKQEMTASLVYEVHYAPSIRHLEKFHEEMDFLKKAQEYSINCFNKSSFPAMKWRVRLFRKRWKVAERIYTTSPREYARHFSKNLLLHLAGAGDIVYVRTVGDVVCMKYREACHSWALWPMTQTGTDCFITNLNSRYSHSPNFLH